jgi:hypothetical protein
MNATEFPNRHGQPPQLLRQLYVKQAFCEQCGMNAPLDAKLAEDHGYMILDRCF